MRKVLLFIMILAVPVSYGAVSSLSAELTKNPVMPVELIDVALKSDCRQFDDFYSLPGRRRPAHVYGVEAEEPEAYSAAFWCWREPLRSVLMFVRVGKDGLQRTGEITFIGRPYGLYVRKGKILAGQPDVRELEDSDLSHPHSLKFEGNIIEIGSDNPMIIFYREGKWYKAPGDQ